MTIVMAVYNGAEFLPVQLQSLAQQNHRAGALIASDDGSDDNSVQILRDFGQMMPVTILDGPRGGFARNFLHLISHAPDGHVLAFCDQDDCWLPDRLERAHNALRTCRGPALYCSRRWIWDPAQDRRRMSRAYRGLPSFGNALVENIAPGNTIVLNAAASALARRLAPAADGIYAHDWWLYQIVTGAGGTVIWDPTPTLLYRQHSTNEIGSGEGLLRTATRRIRGIRGQYAARVSQQLAALLAADDAFTPAARDQLAQFVAARQAPWAKRQGLLNRAGAVRHGVCANLALKGALQFGWV